MAVVTIHGEPVAQGRGRIIGLGPRCKACGKHARQSIKDPDKSRAWKDFASASMRVKSGLVDPLGGPLHADVLFASARKSVREGREWKTTKPDIDNLEKSVFDAANGILFHDDAQIASAYIRKITVPYEEGSYTRIEISEAP